MWLSAGLILLGIILGVAGMLIFNRLDLRGHRRRTDRGSPAGVDSQALYETAQAFLLTAETTFGSREEALKPAAWVNPSGKNFIPKDLRKSHAALKEALKATGKRRTPSGANLVQTALKIVQEHNQSNFRVAGADSPKITFAEGQGTQTS